jgi:hypothetical protein
MQIYIKNLTGKTLTFEVEPTDTIEQLKQQIEKRENIPVNRQRLIIRGKSLGNDTFVSEHRLYEVAAIHLVLTMETPKENDS